LKVDYWILVIFGTNIPDTNSHQMIFLCFRLTERLFLHYRGKLNKQNITFLFNAVSLCDSNNVHSAYFLQMSSTLTDSLI